MDKKELQEAQSIIDSLFYDGKVITGWQHTLLQNVISIAETKLCQTDVSGSRFQSAYAQYWDMVKDIIDEEGWVYTKEAPHMLDAYFESNTGKSVEFQKSFGKSGDNPHWLTKGSRWRPSELS